MQTRAPPSYIHRAPFMYNVGLRRSLDGKKHGLFLSCFFFFFPPPPRGVCSFEASRCGGGDDSVACPGSPVNQVLGARKKQCFFFFWSDMRPCLGPRSGHLFMRRYGGKQ